MVDRGAEKEGDVLKTERQASQRKRASEVCEGLSRTGGTDGATEEEDRRAHINLAVVLPRRVDEALLLVLEGPVLVVDLWSVRVWWEEGGERARKEGEELGDALEGGRCELELVTKTASRLEDAKWDVRAPSPTESGSGRPVVGCSVSTRTS